MEVCCGSKENQYRRVDQFFSTQRELPIRAHIVDTHGYTDHVFGLCYLLGFSFMPRLKNLAARRLFTPAGSPEAGLFGSRSYAQLDALFSGTSDLNLIAEQGDGLARVAASLKNRAVSASHRAAAGEHVGLESLGQSPDATWASS